MTSLLVADGLWHWVYHATTNTSLNNFLKRPVPFEFSFHDSWPNNNTNCGSSIFLGPRWLTPGIVQAGSVQ
jgi:hypothetical protein